MTAEQRQQNPDVNSYQPDTSPGEQPGSSRDDRGGDVERKPENDVIPVPPDAHPTAPIEEPPGVDGAPIGDVDDSPTKIA